MWGGDIQTKHISRCTYLKLIVVYKLPSATHTSYPGITPLYHKNQAEAPPPHPTRRLHMTSNKRLHNQMLSHKAYSEAIPTVNRQQHGHDTGFGRLLRLPLPGSNLTTLVKTDTGASG
jgi:hypothetical protein